MEQREDAIDEEVSQKKLSETQMANLKDLIDKIEKAGGKIKQIILKS